MVAGYSPLVILKIRRNRRISAFDAALPDAIEMCSRALRAGHSMSAAFGILADQAVEPAKTEFGEVFRKQSYGLPLRDALLQMLNRVPSKDLQVFLTSVLVQKDTGGNLAELLERTVAVIRERLRIQREIRTQTAQGRLTGWILFFLPPVLLVLLNIISPGYSAILFHDPVGLKMLYTGLLLLVTGGLLMRHIINGIEV
jgi:tight adherence protein B